MQGHRRVLQAWLKDAHAMERATVDNLERQLRRLDDQELRSMLGEHLERSKAQIGRLEDGLRRLGAEPSMMKDAATRFTGMAETWLAGASPDEAVKNCIATYAYEQFEVACYAALAAAAEACGEAEIQRMCEEEMEEERAFAERLRERLPAAVRRHLEQEGARQRPGMIADLGVVARRNPIPVAALAAAGLGAVAMAAAGARRLVGGGAIHLRGSLPRRAAGAAQLRSADGEPARPAHGRGAGRRLAGRLRRARRGEPRGGLAARADDRGATARCAGPYRSGDAGAGA
jgi:ferritin-like metal-binding protein YciE